MIGRRANRLLPLIAFCQIAVRRVAAADVTYFVSADGDDRNRGTDAGHPFRSVRPLTALGPLGPGTRVLLRGGDRFAGPLNLRLAGTAAARCTLGAYGTGPATLVDAPPFTAPICELTDAEYVTVERLRFVGTPGRDYGSPAFRPANFEAGLSIACTRSGGTRLRSVIVRQCEFRDTRYGLWIDASAAAGRDGIDGVAVTDNVFDSVYQLGCYVLGYGYLRGGPTDQFRDVYVGGNQFRNIRGDPNFASEAQPLSVSNATGIVIEGNTFVNNCGLGGLSAGSPNGGSTALSVSNCRDFHIRYNVVTGTHCCRKFDGSAVDLDQDARDGEVACNVTFLNDGPSVQMGSFKDRLTGDVAVYGNVSLDDGRGTQKDSVQGVLRFWGNADGVAVYHNVVVLGPGAIGTPSGVSFETGHNTNVAVTGNLFLLPRDVPAIRPNGTVTGEFAATTVDPSFRFADNWCFVGR